jgi:hypothetical protein
VAAVPIIANAGAVTQAVANVRQPMLVAFAQARTGAQTIVAWPGEPVEVLDPLAVFTAVPDAEPLDLLSEVPPFERSASEIQAVLRVVGNELQRVETARQALILNFAPANADALLPMFEQLLGLPVDPPGLTLDSRRQLVLASMRRLKGPGDVGVGRFWEDTITALLGASWNYAESNPTPYNLVLNPNFDHDTPGTTTPLGYYSPTAGFGTHQVVSTWADTGSQSLHVTSSLFGPTSSFYIAGPDAGPGAMSSWTGWNVSRFKNNAFATRIVHKINTMNGQWSAGVLVDYYDASGALLQTYADGNPSRTTIGTYPQAGAFPLLSSLGFPSIAGAVWLRVSVFVQANVGGSIDINYDSVGIFDAPWPTKPVYGDGDMPGYTWTGTPGNSTSLAGPPANTVLVRIPSSMAGIAWPFIRDLTPAHLAITEGYTDGFFVGLTPVGNVL